MTWILIFAMYSAPMADNDFSSVHSQEFSSQDRCEAAKLMFERKFQTLKSVSSIAVCVQK